MAGTEEKDHIVHLRLTCIAPPSPERDDGPVEFGLQDRKQLVHPGQPHADGSVSYDIMMSLTRQDAVVVRFRGPYVHGSPAAPFLYLSLKRREESLDPWIRRLKIPLPSLTWDQVDAAGTAICVAAVSGTGSGTVPLLGKGWTWRHSLST